MDISKPKWWQSFALLPLMVGLFALQAHVVTSPRGHQAIQIGIMMFIFGCMVLWVHVNTPALASEASAYLRWLSVAEYDQDLFPASANLPSAYWHEDASSPDSL